MADVEEDEEEFSDEEDYGHDDSSDKDGKKKKQLIMAGGLVLGIIILAVVAAFFSGGFGSSKEEDENAESARKAKLVTGHGEVLTAAIPDLEPIPYPTEEANKAAKGDAAAKGEQQEADKATATGTMLANGEMVYTAGEAQEVGVANSAPGVVMVDQLQVEIGEHNEKRIEARILNQGGKFLHDVAVDILFLDSRGETVLARSVNPLVISGGLFGDKVQTLWPGRARKFIVDATDVPKSWSGALRPNVTSYSFVQ